MGYAVDFISNAVVTSQEFLKIFTKWSTKKKNLAKQMNLYCVEIGTIYW